VHRCLRKEPARRFQTMADLKVALEELKDESDSGRLTTPEVKVARKRRWSLLAATAAIAAVAVAGAWWIWGGRPTPGTGNRGLRQLTYDDGTTGYPALSPDAKLVAYQSDRAGPGRYDIWVQQTAGGSAIRLTNGPGSHQHPVFSGDGAKIYFDSTGPPAGIYEVSALGGESHLIAADGVYPAVSPDGKNIAFITRTSGQIFVMPTSGGEPRLVAPGFSVIPIRPVWSFNNQDVVFYGMKVGQPQTIEWWFVRASGGTPQQTNLGHWAAENRYVGHVSASLPGNMGLGWLARDGNTQIYRVHNMGAANGYRLIGELEPLTFGGSVNQYPSVAAGKMAFSSGTMHGAIWSLPADTNQGRVTGPLQKLTSERAAFSHVALSRDGTTMVYSSDRSGGQGDIFLRDMVSGQEHAMAADEPDKSKQYGQIDAGGTEVLYTSLGVC